MKTITRISLAFLAVGSLCALGACSSTPKPADASDAASEDQAASEDGDEEEQAEEGSGKKSLEEMKGGRMEKADAEE